MTTTSALSLATMKSVSVLVGAIALAHAVLPSHGEQGHPTARVALAGPPRMLRGAADLGAQPSASSATDTREDDEFHKQHKIKTVVQKIAIPIAIPISVPQYIPVPISQPSTVIASDTSTSSVISTNSVVGGGLTVAGGPAGGVAGGPGGLSGGGVPSATPASTRPGERPQTTPAASVPQRVTPAPTTLSGPEPRVPTPPQARPEPIGANVGTGTGNPAATQLTSNDGAQAMGPLGSVGGGAGTTGNPSGTGIDVPGASFGAATSAPGGGAFGPGASFGGSGNFAGMGIGGMNQASGPIGSADSGFANPGAASFGNGGSFGGAPGGFGGSSGGNAFGGGRGGNAGGNAGFPNSRWRRRRRRL